MLLGFVLGKLMEENLRRALIISRGDRCLTFSRAADHAPALLGGRRDRCWSDRAAALDPEGPRRGLRRIARSP